MSKPVSHAVDTASIPETPAAVGVSGHGRCRNGTSAVTPAFAVMGIIGSRSLLGESLRFFCLGLLLLFVFAFASGRFVG